MDFTEGIPRNEYLDLRKSFRENEVESTKSLDQALITLSSIIIGASVTFIEKPISKPQSAPWLVYAWIVLAACIVVTLLSFYIAQIALRRSIAKLDRIYRNDPTPHSGRFGTWLRNTFGWVTWDNLVALLNLLSLISFCVGVGLFVFFGYLNLQP